MQIFVSIVIDYEKNNIVNYVQDSKKKKKNQQYMNDFVISFNLGLVKSFNWFYQVNCM